MSTIRFISIGGGRAARRAAAVALAAVAAAGLAACDKGEPGSPGGPTAGGGAAAVVIHKSANPGSLKLAFITNNTSQYWKICQGGVAKFTKETGIPVEFKSPQNGKPEEQNGIIENLVSQSYDGMAVSVVAPDEQVSTLNAAAAKVNLICCDSDSPKSNRIEYIGTENYTAGVELGKDIVRLLPAGGKIAVFVGTFSADNAHERLRGIEDQIKGHGIDIVERKEDNKDDAKAQSNVEDVMVAHPDLKLVVGLWSYNGPAIASAIGAAHKKGQVLAAVFDQEDDTLKGVQDGTITCTVVQDPFGFGYKACQEMKAMAEQGPAFKVPSDHKVLFPVKTLDATNIEAYIKDLAAEKAG